MQNLDKKSETLLNKLEVATGKLNQLIEDKNSRNTINNGVNERNGVEHKKSGSNNNTKVK